MKPKAIIFDIDGTLADITHRLHFIKGEKKDYDGFYRAVKDDAPKKDIISLLHLIETSNFANWLRGCEAEEEMVKIFFCSGRPESTREDTLSWYHKHISQDNDPELCFRKNGDYRQDHIVKEEMLREIQKDYDILFTVDDRQQVVDMWRRNGITCLQVEQWEENRAPKFPSGKLVLMVGPSGAGKTSFLHAVLNVLMEFDGYISTDATRKMMTGNEQDQSQNDRVFSYVHDYVKTRLSHGLNTYVDATNIRNADRRAFLNLAPKDCAIEYWVVDRPLAKKIEHGGWRNDVKIKGKSLIEYHDNIFRSNLKDILVGDNDPRVTARDYRET